MDEQLLLDLLAEAKKRGGGMLLNVGDTPQAVVLSVDAYAELLAGRPGMLSVAQATPEVEAPVVEQKPKTILVTGGAGYIGGHVVREALAAGYKIVVLDSLVVGRREHVPDDVTFIEGDVRDINLLRDIFSQYAIDAVVHLAALLEVQESVEKPEEYFEVNAAGTIRLLQAMREAGITELVCSSTAAVYGPQTTVPIPESAVCNPINPYGASKLMAEQAISYFARFTNLKATIFRYFNVAGIVPGWGVTDTHHRAHLIPVVLDVAKGAQAVLTLNGDDYDTYDGTCVRDYVHVGDIARAHLAALGHAKLGVRVYNIGTGRGASVKEVVQQAAEVTGRMIPMETGPRRPGDDSQTVADASLIKKELGFEPAQSSLENIIQSSWQSAGSKNEQTLANQPSEMLVSAGLQISADITDLRHRLEKLSVSADAP